MEEIHEFCFKEFAAVCLFWNFFVIWSSNNITYQRNAQYAYCGGSFLCRNRYLCEDASRISPMIVSMEFVTLLCSMASI